MTGMSTRIGYPNEHLAAGNVEEVASPIYSTGIGLVIKGLNYLDKQKAKEGSDSKDKQKIVKVRGGSDKVRGGILESLIKIFHEDTK